MMKWKRSGRAERRGFAPQAELDDWLAAEAEIDGLLAGGASDGCQARERHTTSGDDNG